MRGVAGSTFHPSASMFHEPNSMIGGLKHMFRAGDRTIARLTSMNAALNYRFAFSVHMLACPLDTLLWRAGRGSVPKHPQRGYEIPGIRLRQASSRTYPHARVALVR